MDCQKLLDEGKLVPAKITQAELKKILTMVDNDLKVADSTIENNIHCAYTISYHACLKVSYAYMKSQGYKPANAQAHEHIFEYMKAAMGKPCEEYIRFFEGTRTRHDEVVFDVVETLSDIEAQELLRQAKEYTHKVKNKIQTDYFNRPGK